VEVVEVALDYRDHEVDHVLTNAAGDPWGKSTVIE
jgi:hypothetical protein